MDSKVLKFEHFINNVLRGKLQALYEEREKIAAQAGEYLQLKTAIQNLQRNDTRNELRMKVDIGCNFFCQARVPDASKIFICLGMGIFCEMSHLDALEFIEEKKNLLERRIELLGDQCAEIKAQIQIGLQGLNELQGLSVTFEEKPNDLWS